MSDQAGAASWDVKFTYNLNDSTRKLHPEFAFREEWMPKEGETARAPIESMIGVEDSVLGADDVFQVSGLG